MYTDVDSVTTIQKVGLLDIRQIERAGNFDSFLINKNSEYMVGNLCDNSNLCQMSIEGKKFFVGSPNNFQGVRAVIKIFDFTIIEGDGTLTSSYRTTNKTSDTNEVQVGEYINVPYSGDDNACGVDNMCTFRVVSKDNDSIKVVLNGLLPNTSKYGSTVTITISHTIYTSLNKFIEGISDMYRYTKNKTFYIGDYPKSSSYKDVQDEFLESSVGLPTVGEMFSSNDIALGTTSDKTFVDVNTIENLTVSIYYWTMNRFSSTGILAVYSGKLVSQKDTSFGVRPVIYLKSGLTFTGGEGTAQSPYTLK